MKKQSLVHKLNVILPYVVTILLFAVVYLIAPTCDHLVELKNGMMTHMKCYYVAQISIALGILLVALSIKHSISQKADWILFIVIGILLIIVPSWIGLCGMTTMPCHKTALWIRIIGVLTIVEGVINVIDDKAEN